MCKFPASFMNHLLTNMSAVNYTTDSNRFANDLYAMSEDRQEDLLNDMMWEADELLHDSPKYGLLRPLSKLHLNDEIVGSLKRKYDNKADS
mmetsp:Transcript_4577/g.11587  ORF Transcript_4577/g.11587 Transcript_4577/m.11587 type:complete len:91 (+) Transcript_4577:22-294(+)